MQLYWSPQSRAIRALWMLEEIGQPYERVLLDLRKGDQAKPDYLRINPMGKVPAIRDGAVTVAESGAVLLYLNDRFPAAGLAPPQGDPQRGRYLQWLFFAAGSIEPAAAEKSGVLQPGDPSQQGWGSYEKVMAVLEAGLQPGPWLLGERFSAADVLVGIDLIFLMRIARLLPEQPVFTAYLDRCAARPAYRRAQQIDQDGARALGA